MSGRTLLWDGALRLFYKNPIIGNGMNIDTLMSNLVFGKGYTNAHNCFLQLAIISGLVGISLFFIMFFLLSKPLSENKYDAKCAMFSCCILASAFCGTFYIDMLSIRFFAMLVIGYFLPQIIKDVKGSYTFVEKTSAIDSTKYIKK
jgi:O-antigen ligase